METINCGIDLGTTNSGIAIYQNGKVQLLKNPVGFNATLPSVVAFKKERILVGDKANEQLLSHPDRVFSSFKRRMGTADFFPIPGTDKQTHPVELSSYVLKELLNFSIQEKIESAVITIPASFDTIQSNATKEAGYRSGLREVVLLQEPIAACLAYANENELDITAEKNWLVYDFGGGTFDAAIVRINERELKVIDNNGNNFLGGVDLDLKILAEIIIPKLTANTDLEDIWAQINDKTNHPYQKLGKYLLYKTEELKKELSLKEEAWVELSFPEFDLEEEIKVTRPEFDRIVAPLYNASFELVDELLQSNAMQFTDFERIIMVGGTTYIPYIRQQLALQSGCQVDTSIDPTTAVIVGAAYYAGNKPSQLGESITEDTALTETEPALGLTLSVENLTQDLEELIAFKTDQPFNGYYRITRNDGGYDSGEVPFSNQANEFVTLLPKQVNRFNLSITDSNHQQVYSKHDIVISHGLYNVNGQPLPNDICIELDAEDETYLELIFKKNTILPLKKMIYKTFSKSIAKGSDDKVIINIVEGKVGTLPGANLNIGYIEIKGTDLKDDLIRGTDIELNFSVSESRDLTVEVYIPGADQEIVETFNPQYQGEPDNRKVLVEINQGLNVVHEQLAEYEGTENYEELGKLMKLKQDLQDLKGSFLLAVDEILTGNIFQLQERKRRLLYTVDQLIFLRDITYEIERFKRHKNNLLQSQDQFTPAMKHDFDQIVRDERSFLQSGDKFLIRRKTKALEKLSDTLFYNNDDSYYLIYFHLKTLDPEEFRDYEKVERLFEQGDEAAEKNEMKKLKSICYLIYPFVKDKGKNEPLFSGTGLK